MRLQEKLDALTAIMPTARDAVHNSIWRKNRVARHQPQAPVGTDVGSGNGGGSPRTSGMFVQRYKLEDRAKEVSAMLQL